MKIKTSETVIIKRSLINFAPYNPKVHSKDSIRQQQKNFKQVGFLGGIVWNEATGNLVSGHKRIMVFDLEYKYDGTEKTDYDVKVEKVNLTETQEKEQNIFMDSQDARTKIDNSLLTRLIPEIDYKNAGISDTTIERLNIEFPSFKWGETKEIKEDNRTLEKIKEDQDKVKALRKNIGKDKDKERLQTHFSIVFKTYEEKAEFLEAVGINGDDIIIDGKYFIKQLNEK